jgi:hypothetical protein
MEFSGMAPFSFDEIWFWIAWPQPDLIMLRPQTSRAHGRVIQFAAKAFVAFVVRGLLCTWSQVPEALGSAVGGVTVNTGCQLPAD